ncbi:N-6 DNA methylase [Tenacibaculum litopenaei]|uniref:N-6 DNA methylase n=1 Tax=Tenacibaculum litopenaei TaxID=396016 RepID=UPI0038B6368D
MIGRTHGISRVFNDLLTMGICSFHQTNIQSQLIEQDENNEALYMETIKPYSKEELNELSKALGALQLSILDKPYSDLLGEYFTINITKGHNGQFFTPDPVCEMIARMTLPNLDTEEGKRILDPACESGRMLLSAAKINPKNYFFGADNDCTCAKMATLNFFSQWFTGGNRMDE